MEPKPGEYWYVISTNDGYLNNCYLVYILGENLRVSGEIIVKEYYGLNKERAVSIKINQCVVKWKPNWFFRLLGYK